MLKKKAVKTYNLACSAFNCTSRQFNSRNLLRIFSNIIFVCNKLVVGYLEVSRFSSFPGCFSLMINTHPPSPSPCCASQCMCNLSFRPLLCRIRGRGGGMEGVMRLMDKQVRENSVGVVKKVNTHGHMHTCTHTCTNAHT